MTQIQSWGKVFNQMMVFGPLQVWKSRLEPLKQN